MLVRLWLLLILTVCKIEHILATMKNELYPVQHNKVFIIAAITHYLKYCILNGKGLVSLHVQFRVQPACQGSVMHLPPHLRVA